VHRSHAYFVPLGLILCFVGNGAASRGGRPETGQRDASSLARLLADYESGNLDVVRTRAASARVTGADVDALRDLSARWRGNWQPRRAMFILDLAIAASETARTDSLAALLDHGLAYFASIPVGVSAGPILEFERLWQRTAIAVLQKRLAWRLQEEYLAKLRKRSQQIKEIPADPRFILALAISRTQRCCTAAKLAQASTEASNAITLGPGVGPAAPRLSTVSVETVLDGAIASFKAASALDEIRAEATVRGALLQIYSGRPQAALESLDSIGDIRTDRELNYWRHLFRARALAHLNRHADAEAAFRAALDAWPQAQSAGVGLALTLFRLSRSDVAAAVANEVRTWPEDAFDPWWHYEQGDARFLVPWQTQLTAWIR